jgi:3-hydroxybutyryl-CoA dehydrogenase
VTERPTGLPAAGARAGVIGAGTMGIGIAHALAACGATTTVVESSRERADGVRPAVSAVLEKGVARGRLDPEAAAQALDRISVVGSVDELEPGLDLLIESVPESFELKRTVLAAAEARRPVLLATNTSSLSVTSLAEALSRPADFCGLHFFNPVWALKLVEVVRGRGTSDATVDRALGWVSRLGKEAAVVNDAPGFATSRLDLCLALESIRMVQEDVADPEHIDRAVRLAYRHPVGPLELSDIVGLDVRLDIARSLESSLGPRYSPPWLLEQLVAAGDLGRKSGRGFYDWTSGRPESLTHITATTRSVPS